MGEVPRIDGLAVPTMVDCSGLYCVFIVALANAYLSFRLEPLLGEDKDAPASTTSKNPQNRDDLPEQGLNRTEKNE